MTANPTSIPVLWHLKVSNYNEKARWALDHKGVPHLRKAVMPGSHRRVAKRLCGGYTFPVMEVEGEAIGDSTEIIAALERRHPNPPLYPADPAKRREALELEEFFDENLGPYTRRLVIHSLSSDADLFLRTFTPDMGAVQGALARASFPIVRRRLNSDFQLDEAAVEEAYEKLHKAGEVFRARLGPNGYLVGESFTVADLTLAALVAPVVAPEQFPYHQPQRDHPLLAGPRKALTESGIWDWTGDLYARHRGASAEIAAV